MLEINKKQMEAFSQLQFLKLKQQIARELSEKIDDWKQFDKKKQSQLVDFLFSEAHNANMVYEVEYILFALVCMSAEDDCQIFVGRGDVDNILLDEELDNKDKLIKLSELTTIKIKKIENAWEINRRKDDV